MPASPFDLAGLVGAALIVVTYLLLQVRRIDARSRAFSALNALGAGAILVSLIEDFNAGAAVVEGFWVLVSLYGLVRNWNPPTDAATGA